MLPYAGRKSTVLQNDVYSKNSLKLKLYSEELVGNLMQKQKIACLYIWFIKIS